MSVIIRLQNLPWTANALDIRHFFNGLHIPDGGVHIVGGEEGDAFIAFSSDEDARKAMLHARDKISGQAVQLMLSSKSEMQSIIAKARGVPTEPQRIPANFASIGPLRGGPGYTGPHQGGPDFRGPPPGPNVPPQNLPPMHSGPPPPFQGGPGPYRPPVPPIRQPINGPHIGAMVMQPPPNFGPSGSLPQNVSQPVPGPWPGNPGMRPQMQPTQGLPMPVLPPQVGSSGNFPLPPANTGFPQSSDTGNGYSRKRSRTRSPRRSRSPSRRYRSRSRSRRRSRSRSRTRSPRSRHSRDRYSPHRSRHRSSSSKREVRMHSPHDRGYSRDRDREREVSRGRKVIRVNHSQERHNHERRSPERRDLGRRSPERRSLGRRSPEIRPERHSIERCSPDRKYEKYSNRDYRDQPPYRERDRGFSREKNYSSGRRRSPQHDSYRRERSLTPDVRHHSRISPDPVRRLSPPPRGHGEETRDREMHDYRERSRSKFSAERRVEKMYRSDSRDRADYGHNDAHKEHHDLRERIDSVERRESERSSRYEKGRPREGSPFDDRRYTRVYSTEDRGEYRPRYHKHDDEELPQDDLYLFVRNLPLQYNYKEIKHFFSGLYVHRDGIKIINDTKGRRSGCAYIRFASELTKRNAEKLDGEYADANRVQITQSDWRAFRDAVDSYVPEGYYHNSSLKDVEDDEFCMAISRLPRKLERTDIADFFRPYKIVPGSIYVEYDGAGYTSGRAYCKFVTYPDLKGAMSRKGSLLLGSKVWLDRIHHKEMGECISKHQFIQHKRRVAGGDFSRPPYMRPEPRTRGSPKSDDGSESMDAVGEPESGPSTTVKNTGPGGAKDLITPSEGYDCVKVKGIPFHADENMVRNFFGSIDIPDDGIHLIINSKGQALTHCFVELRSQEDCKRALKLDMEYIGQRYINVTPITKQDLLLEVREMEETLLLAKDKEWANKAAVKGGTVVIIENVPYKARTPDIETFFMGYEYIPDSIYTHYITPGTSMNSGYAALAFENKQEAKRAIDELNGTVFWNRTVVLLLQENSE